MVWAKNFSKQGGGNRRVRNATKALSGDGTKCDSKLEAYCYDTLRSYGIPFEFQRVFELQEGFRDYRGKWVRPIKIVLDFWFPWCGIAMDTKGFATPDAKIKIKLWEYGHREGRVLLPSSRKKVDAECLWMLGRYRGE